jgi:hypothetical protein
MHNLTNTEYKIASTDVFPLIFLNDTISKPEKLYEVIKQC